MIRDDALADARTTIFRSDWYTRIREDLGKYRILVDDTPKLAKLVNRYEYDVNKVIKEFSNLGNLRLRYNLLQNIMPSLENRKEERNENVLNFRHR